MIKTLLNKIFTSDRTPVSLKKYEKHIRIGKEVKLENIQIEIRKPMDGHVYLEVGDGSVVSGKFVFESERSSVVIGKNTFIGGGLFVCHDRINIGSDVMISWGCTVIDNDAHSLNSAERMNDVSNWKKGMEQGIPWKYKDWSKVKIAAISIGDHAWIGFNSIILKGVNIGKSAIIGAGSVVTKNVDEAKVAAGNPATEIKPTV